MKFESKEKFAAAGIDTGKYFSIQLPNGLKPGACVTVEISENGQPVIVDAIERQIYENGYVKNTKLHRRFVMAQMFRMLNWSSYGPYGNGGKGYTDYLNTHYDNKYQFDMMLREVHVLTELDKSDREAFEERNMFFNTKTVVRILDEYMHELKRYIDTLQVKHCKGVPYKTIPGKGDVFVDDIEKKIYAPLKMRIEQISYGDVTDRYVGRLVYVTERYLGMFVKEMVRLPYNWRKCATWVDKFKGEGAYYTMKNLIMFHGCRFDVGNGLFATSEDSMRMLNHYANDYKDAGWRLFGVMKELISDNHFDFNERMKEIYG